MKTTNHTSAPWAIHTCKENGPSLDSFYLSTTAQTWDGNEEERIVCRFPTGTGQFSDMGRENLANARLISSAPEMLQALQSCLDYLLMDSMIEEDAAPEIESIRKAISKAKGDLK